MKRWCLTLSVAGLLASSVAYAQDQNTGQADGGRRGGKGMRGSDPMTNVERLTEILKLDANQQNQLKQLLTEYQQARKDLESKTPQDVRDKQKDLENQMRQARKNRDKQKGAELAKQLQELRKGDPAAQEAAKLRQQLVTEIEKILRDDQKQVFRSEFKLGPKGGSLNNPGMLKACLSRIQVRPDQKAEIDKLDQQYREAIKGLPKEAKGTQRSELGRKYCEDVMRLLDENQKKQLQDVAAAMANAPKGALANPKQLEEAVKTLQLRPDQQTSITALFDRYKTDRRALPKDQPAAQSELNQKLANDVLAVLDQAQKEQLMKYQPVGRGMGEPKKRGKQGEQVGQQ